MRKERVESLLKRELALIINQKLSDPRLAMITVTEVRLSNDLKNAWVYISMLEGQEEKLKVIENARSYIKRLLSERVRMKFMPEFIFKIDNSYEEGAKIDRLLDDIKKTDSG